MEAEAGSILTVAYFDPDELMSLVVKETLDMNPGLERESITSDARISYNKRNALAR